MQVHADDPVIEFPEKSLIAKFFRCEKRFLVEVESNGERFWVHSTIRAPCSVCCGLAPMC